MLAQIGAAEIGAIGANWARLLRFALITLARITTGGVPFAEEPEVEHFQTGKATALICTRANVRGGGSPRRRR